MKKFKVTASTLFVVWTKDYPSFAAAAKAGVELGIFPDDLANLSNTEQIIGIEVEVSDAQAGRLRQDGYKSSTRLSMDEQGTTLEDHIAANGEIEPFDDYEG